jgi:arylsulfatase A-like enzyme
LEKYGFADNTLLIFTNDNGGPSEEINRPFRGTKNTTFEGGVRVPCIIRWPGHTKAGTVNDGMMFIADFFTTFITLAAGRHEQKLPVDGLDMTRMLFQGESSPRDEIVFEVSGSVRIPTIRKGDYKLMGKLLYNIKTDPYERTDIASQYPDIVQTLRTRLLEVDAERPPLGDKPLLMEPPLPYVYGIEENENPPQWLKTAVEQFRATQPQKWAPGKTPWPQAPKAPVGGI